MTVPAAESRSILYRVLQLVALAHLGLYAFLTLDWLLHPFAMSSGALGLPLPPVGRLVFMLVLGPVTLVLGVLVLRRTRDSIIGLLLIIWSASLLLFVAREELHPVVLMITNFRVWFIPLFLLPIFFPSGKAPIRGVELLVTGQIIVNLITGVADLAAAPTLVQFGLHGANPFYVEAATSIFPWVERLWQLVNLTYVLQVVLLIVAPILHYRRGGPHQRAQIKWFALFAAQMGTLSVLWSLGAAVYGNEWQNAPPEISTAFLFLFVGYLGIFPAVPVAYGILRHRLYDIDIIIRRTLIYGVLTTLLATIYLGGVVLLQALLRPITGAGNDLAVVATTLGIAALVLPLRRRVQSFIDRRFYRRKYDAARTLVTFGRVARDEVDLDRLTSRLVDVVEETMQPQHVSLWLKKTQ